jgi:AcrR family transcriptional regulator
MVLAAALELADERGLEELSMRAVASRLGVTPMALYRHVGDKHALLDGIVELLLMELPLPDPADHWRARLDQMSAAMRATARRHPTVFPLLLRRPAATPGALRVREAVYDALRASGLAEPDVERAERMLSTFILGFAASESGGRFSVGSEQLDADLDWFGEQLLGAVSGGTDGLTAAQSGNNPQVAGVIQNTSPTMKRRRES